MLHSPLEIILHYSIKQYYAIEATWKPKTLRTVASIQRSSVQEYEFVEMAYLFADRKIVAAVLINLL